MIKRYAQNSYYMLTEGEYGQWCKYEDVQKLEQENEGLVSLVDEILNCIPETYLTGYGWDDDLKEIVKLEAIRGEG